MLSAQSGRIGRRAGGVWAQDQSTATAAKSRALKLLFGIYAA
jgi:hypothetical protein